MCSRQAGNVWIKDGEGSMHTMQAFTLHCPSVDGPLLCCSSKHRETMALGLRGLALLKCNYCTVKTKDPSS